jgi:hypothetical protein
LANAISYTPFNQVGKLVEHLIATGHPGGTDALKTGPQGVQNLYKKLSQAVPFSLDQAGMSGIMQHAGVGAQAMATHFGNNVNEMGPMGPNATLAASLIGTALMNPNVANSEFFPNTTGAYAQTVLANTNPAPGMGIPTNSSANLIHVAVFTDPVTNITFTLLNATEGPDNPLTPTNPEVSDGSVPNPPLGPTPG